MPDGRLLLANRRTLVFGDGTRWEQARAVDTQPPIFGDVAVDVDGSIYYGLAGAIGRIEFGSDGRWRADAFFSLPPNPEVERKTMVSVLRVGDDWLWYSGTGLALGRRPGGQPRSKPRRDPDPPRGRRPAARERPGERSLVSAERSATSGGISQYGSRIADMYIPVFKRLIKTSTVIPNKPLHQRPNEPI